MTRDENPLDPKVLEFKFFAKGVGPVLAIGVSGGSDREELVSYRAGRADPRPSSRITPASRTNPAPTISR